MADDQSLGFGVHVSLGEAPWYDQEHRELVLEAPTGWWEKNVDVATRAGVISRIALQLVLEVKEAGSARRHGCASRYGHEREREHPCGSCTSYDVIDQIGPLSCDDSACVVIVVSDAEGQRWLDRARELLTQVLVNDASSPPVDANHDAVVVLNEAGTAWPLEIDA
jgi:hypothetical protein